MAICSVFTCEICDSEKPQNDCFYIKPCNHSYCADCISKYIASKLDDNFIPIPCPIFVCDAKLNPEDCRSIIPQQMFDRWGAVLCEASISQAFKLYCPYEDCSTLLIKDEDGMCVKSECPVCRRSFCAHCKVRWHMGMDCNDFQKSKECKDEVLLHQVAKSENWKQCPRCNIYIEKFAKKPVWSEEEAAVDPAYRVKFLLDDWLYSDWEDCKLMHCRCCGYDFCYFCGDSYKSKKRHDGGPAICWCEVVPPVTVNAEDKPAREDVEVINLSDIKWVNNSDFTWGVSF